MTRLIPDWEIRITNFGLGYILICLVVAIAATNTGNNGLYLVLAAMLAAMAVSGVLSRRNVRGVVCEIETVGEVVATRPAWLKLRLREPADRRARRRRSSSCTSGCPGPLWIDPLAPGREARDRRRGALPAARRLSATPTRDFCRAFRSASSASTAGRRCRARSSSTRCPRSRRCRRCPPEDSRGGRPAPARARRRLRHPDAARVHAGRRSARPALEAVGADASLDRPGARGRAGPRASSWPSTTRCRRPSIRRRSHASSGRSRAARAQALLLLSRGGEVGFQARGVKVAAHGGPQPAAAHPRGARAAGARRARRPRRISRRCAAATCGGSCRDARQSRWTTRQSVSCGDPRDAAGLRRAYLLVLAPAAALAPLPLLWTGGSELGGRSSLYEASSRCCGWRAARDRAVPSALSDAALNVAGLALPGAGSGSRPRPPGRAPAVRVPPAALHRPRQARVAQASERGAHGAARRCFC